MRVVIPLGVIFLMACHPTPGPATAPIPQTVLAPGAPGPDTISCDTPVVVNARSDEDGVREERAWLNEHYPGHSRYGQGLVMKGRRAFDVLEFTTAEGHSVSVCFDITASYGRF